VKEQFFVTGATGCIGSWVVKNLIETGCEVHALVRGGNLDKLKLIMSDAEISKVHILRGDISDGDLLEAYFGKNRIRHIIHLAAMQLPLCRANPRLGARVNVEGTVNIFETAKKNGIHDVVYSSSTAVYGKAGDYESGCFDHNSPLIPTSHYGVFKQANEWDAKVYYHDAGLSSIGIRPFVVYGPLRDQGMTSTPTLAMKSAVELKQYEITYGGKFEFQYVDDTAKAFIKAALCEHEGADAYNLGGETVDMKDVVKAIEDVLPRTKGLISYINTPLPFPQHANDRELEKLIGPVCTTPLSEGVKKSIEIFDKAIKYTQN